ncbi:MAG: glycosyltransferase [Bacteroidales bacterium]|nr:glycosyltransferase [Bacteroidales bacterium]
MEEKLLSIVVPVYKVEPYIDKCLSSLVLENPSLMNRLEVIIVNDGTPDNSAEMSRAYVKRYPATFRQIDKENGGHGSAWNVGLKEAKGKYLRFLDSDDWFTDLDRLMEDLKGCDADIVFNPFIKELVYEGRTETVPVPPGPSSITRIDPSVWGTFRWGYFNVNFWGVTYKTAILKPLYPLFAEKTMYDDFILTWAPLVYGRTYATLDYPVYHYLIGRPGQSMSATQQRKGAISYAKCFEQYESVWNRVADNPIPQDLSDCIRVAIATYARFIFVYMLYLPYEEAKKRMAHLWDRYVKNIESKSKLEKRYAAFPFFLFFATEQFRIRVLKRLVK